MRTGSVIVFLAILLLVSGFRVYDGAAQVAVIANKSVPINSITKTELHDLYAFEIREWTDGQPVTVFDLEQEKDLRAVFYKFLGRSPSRMKSIWLVNKLAGEGEPPEALPSKESMIQRIIETPGAIGFIQMPVENDQLKVLAIID